MASGVGGGPPCADDIPEVMDREAGLFLRPLSKLNIVVKLPQLKTPGQSISNWDLMEKLKKAIVPIQLDAIRVRESSLENVSFDAELNSRLNMHRVINGLDGLSLKVAGFVDHLKVRAAEAKCDFPSRLDWDDHYYKKGRAAGAGTHPDTVHLAMIPVNWFTSDKSSQPSRSALTKAMAAFGEVRCVDIPSCDPLRAQMPPSISGIAQKAYSFGQELLFEAFVQFSDYAGFTKAMEKLKAKKWMRRMKDGRVHYANVKVDFDRTFHLSGEKIRQRELERRKIEFERKRKEEKEKAEKEAEAEKLRKEQAEKEKRKEERELKRKIEYELERRRLERKKLLEAKLAEEEKEWANRKAVEAKRLLEYVFTRIQTRADHERAEKDEKLKKELETMPASRLELPIEDEDEMRAMLLKQREAAMRERLKEKMRGMVNGVDLPEKENRERKKKEKKSRRRDSSSSSNDRDDSGRKHRKKNKRSRSPKPSKRRSSPLPQSRSENKKRR
ncbi:hypothetical protein PFISCL1PPCAC_10822 [Pristionchus fissidentatus]|uniref:A-kinase anchor protein 17A n=1 Tax=Pristionchus fissidentatus TaxID=1538716 RepID=A0AAV5VLI6_9BILA|nr:hypothetical protein PFISCL1PPCAC_10822 [Pristionchus fissidentatus]